MYSLSSPPPPPILSYVLITIKYFSSVILGAVEWRSFASLQEKFNKQTTSVPYEVTRKVYQKVYNSTLGENKNDSAIAPL